MMRHTFKANVTIYRQITVILDDKDLADGEQIEDVVAEYATNENTGGTIINDENVEVSDIREVR